MIQCLKYNHTINSIHSRLTHQTQLNLYSIAKSDKTRKVDDDDDYVVQQKESQLKKLKERLIHRCKYEHRIKKQQQQQQCKPQGEQQSIDPIQNLANQLKKAIIRKQLNISDNVNKLEHKTFQSIKLINSLHQVQQQFQDKSQNKDIMCSYYHKPYYEFNNKSINKTKSIKIIKHSNYTAKVDMEEAEESNIQIMAEMDQQFKKILQKSKSDKELHITKQQNRHIQFANTNSIRNDNKICKKVVTEQHEECENSANSSLQSIFEKRVSSMYSKSILLQKSIQLNQQASLTKRIRNIQSVYQLNDDMIRTSSQRLQYQQN